MRKISNTVFFYLLVSFASVYGQQKRYRIHTFAFYNFENLFDTIKGSNDDSEWTPKGLQKWTSAKYLQKLENLSKVLVQIGANEQQKASPTIIGAAEIENRGVLEDLIKHPNIINEGYGIVHLDSPDKRGIDVALLYKKKHFRPTDISKIPLIIYKEKAKDNKSKAQKEDTIADDLDTDMEPQTTDHRIYTRDILLVTGFLDEEEVNILVNHWPSRSGGEKKSSPYREAAGRLNRKIIDSLCQINPNAKIITMGDYNDGTYNKSIKEGIGAKLKKSEVKQFGIYNPFEQMAKEGHATLFYRDSGDIFDQIMVSESLIKADFSSFQFWKAGIFNKPFMVQKFGKYAGYPLRHSETEVGYSDHFPVYIYLIKEGN